MAITVRLRWSRRTPTKPGLYWAQSILDTVPPDIVKVVSLENRGIVQTIGSGMQFPLNAFTQWMGPIPEPDEPPI